MILKCKSEFGNFAFAAEAEVSDEQRDVLASMGLLQVLQRTPASKAEKDLAGYGKKRPEGFKRTDIPFSPASALVLKAFLEDAKVEVDEKELPIALDVLVTEYIPERSEPKWKAEKEVFARNKAAGTLLALSTKVSYTGPSEEGGEPAVGFLAAIKAYVAAVTKGL